MNVAPIGQYQIRVATTVLGVTDVIPFQAAGEYHAVLGLLNDPRSAYYENAPVKRFSTEPSFTVPPQSPTIPATMPINWYSLIWSLGTHTGTIVLHGQGAVFPIPNLVPGDFKAILDTLRTGRTCYLRDGLLTTEPAPA